MTQQHSLHIRQNRRSPLIGQQSGDGAVMQQASRQLLITQIGHERLAQGIPTGEHHLLRQRTLGIKKGPRLLAEAVVGIHVQRQHLPQRQPRIRQLHQRLGHMG